MNTSLGLLEVAGLALAIAAADAMVKSAHVRLDGIRRAQGSGWMMISVTGDVAAVTAAVANGADVARRAGGLVAQRVIPRPAGALDIWFSAKDSVAATFAGRPAVKAAAGDPLKNNDVSPASAPLPDDLGLTPVSAPPAADSPLPTTDSPLPAADSPLPATDSPLPATPEPDECNLCHDPACPRRKGEPRAACIHYQTRGTL
ncbi:BMC domain-containing protein [Martelella alba]|uniref:BMC domain-containing protein n=1 Tax=Martelella alba TaxID=2590451 RepID=UPI0026C0C589|nr:BMC domain-containing protein [Martelella alba]